VFWFLQKFFLQKPISSKLKVEILVTFMDKKIPCVQFLNRQRLVFFVFVQNLKKVSLNFLGKFNFDPHSEKILSCVKNPQEENFYQK